MTDYGRVLEVLRSGAMQDTFAKWNRLSMEEEEERRKRQLEQQWRGQQQRQRERENIEQHLELRDSGWSEYVFRPPLGLSREELEQQLEQQWWEQQRREQRQRELELRDPPWSEYVWGKHVADFYHRFGARYVEALTPDWIEKKVPELKILLDPEKYDSRYAGAADTAGRVAAEATKWAAAMLAPKLLLGKLGVGLGAKGVGAAAQTAGRLGRAGRIARAAAPAALKLGTESAVHTLLSDDPSLRRFGEDLLISAGADVGAGLGSAVARNLFPYARPGVRAGFQTLGTGVGAGLMAAPFAEGETRGEKIKNIAMTAAIIATVDAAMTFTFNRGEFRLQNQLREELDDVLEAFGVPDRKTLQRMSPEELADLNKQFDTVLRRRIRDLSEEFATDPQGASKLLNDLRGARALAEEYVQRVTKTGEFNKTARQRVRDILNDTISETTRLMGLAREDRGTAYEMPGPTDEELRPRATTSPEPDPSVRSTRQPETQTALVPLEVAQRQADEMARIQAPARKASATNVLRNAYDRVEKFHNLYASNPDLIDIEAMTLAWDHASRAENMALRAGLSADDIVAVRREFPYVSSVYDIRAGRTKAPASLDDEAQRVVRARREPKIAAQAEPKPTPRRPEAVPEVPDVPTLSKEEEKARRIALNHLEKQVRDLERSGLQNTNAYREAVERRDMLLTGGVEVPEPTPSRRAPEPEARRTAGTRRVEAPEPEPQQMSREPSVRRADALDAEPAPQPQQRVPRRTEPRFAKGDIVATSSGAEGTVVSRKRERGRRVFVDGEERIVPEKYLRTTDWKKISSSTISGENVFVRDTRTGQLVQLGEPVTINTYKVRDSKGKVAEHLEDELTPWAISARTSSPQRTRGKALSFLDIYRRQLKKGPPQANKKPLLKSIAAVRSLIADTKRAPRGSFDADLFVGRQLIRFPDNEMRRLLDDLAEAGIDTPGGVVEFVLRNRKMYRSIDMGEANEFVRRYVAQRATELDREAWEAAQSAHVQKRYKDIGSPPEPTETPLPAGEKRESKLQQWVRRQLFGEEKVTSEAADAAAKAKQQPRAKPPEEPPKVETAEQRPKEPVKGRKRPKQGEPGEESRIAIIGNKERTKERESVLITSKKDKIVKTLDNKDYAIDKAQQILSGGKAPEDVDTSMNVVQWARRTKGARGWGEANIEHAQWGFTEDGKDLKVVGEGIKDILKPVSGKGNSKKADDFVQYITARRLLLDANRGKEVGYSRAELEDIIRRTETDEFKGMLNKLTKFMNNWLDELVKAGKLAPSDRNRMVDALEIFVPVNREQLESAVKVFPWLRDSLIDNRRLIFRSKGASRTPIVNPLEEIIRRNYEFATQTYKGWTTKSLVNLYDNADKEIRKQWRKVMIELKPPEVPKGISITEYANALAGSDEYRARGILVVLQGDKIRRFKLDPELYRTLEGAEPEVLDAFAKVSVRLAQVLRTAATGTGDFGARAITKDVLDRMVYGVGGPLKAFTDIPGSITDMVAKRDIYYKAKASGAFMGFTEKTLKSQSRLSRFLKPGKNDVVVEFSGDGWFRLIDMLDEIPRLGEFKTALEKGLDVGKAAAGARDVVVDFGRGGELAKSWGKYVPFMNASIQGNSKFIREFKKNPIKVTLRSLPVTLMSLATIAIRMSDEELYKRYSEEETWRRNSFWIIPRKNNGAIYIPKPHVTGQVFGSLIEAAFDQWYKEDPEAVKNAVKQLGMDALPNYIPHFMIVVMEQAANVRFYSGQPIVPRREWDWEPWEQYEFRTSEIAKAIGRKMNMSPRRIDALINQLFGGLGSRVVRASDWAIGKATGEEKVETADIIPGSHAFRGYKNIGSKSLNEFYGEWNRLEKKRLAHRRRPETAPGLTDEEYNKWANFKYYEKLIATISKEIRDVREEKMPLKKKKQLIDELELYRVNVAREALGKELIKARR